MRNPLLLHHHCPMSERKTQSHLRPLPPELTPNDAADGSASSPTPTFAPPNPDPDPSRLGSRYRPPIQGLSKASQHSWTAGPRAFSSTGTSHERRASPPDP